MYIHYEILKKIGREGKKNDIYIMKRQLRYEDYEQNLKQYSKIYEGYENDFWYVVEANKIQDLKIKRNKKYQEWIKTDFKDWKKKLRKFELDILDIKIKKENLKQLNK